MPTFHRPQNESERLECLSRLLRNNAEFMSALQVAQQVAQQLGLRSWAIGAGVIRSMVWDELHGFVVPTPVPDWDLVFYDAHLVGESDELDLQRRLQQLCPLLPWEVVNQAAVHHWLSLDLGYTVPAFSSLEEGIASWPETATCVAATLDEQQNLVIKAPLGLADLFDLRVRFNPRCRSVEAFRQRLARKQWQGIWPQLEISPVPIR